MSEKATGRELPANWNSWPREKKVNYLSQTFTRAGLLRNIARRAKIDKTISPTTRLSKTDLASVALSLGEVT